MFPQSTPLRDYIYPVNPPIRFNGLQILGPSHGNDTKTSLGHAHQMKFLLNQKDYSRIDSLLTAVLWPYGAPRPDTAGTEYLDTLKAFRTGTAEVKVLSYELEPRTDSIRRVKFRVVLTAPVDFNFEPRLRPSLALVRP